jgi:hypothetical protein
LVTDRLPTVFFRKSRYGMLSQDMRSVFFVLFAGTPKFSDFEVRRSGAGIARHRRVKD